MRILLRVVGRVMLVLLLVVLAVQLYFFIMCGWYRWHNPGVTSFMQHSLAAARQTEPNVKLQQNWVPLSRISENLRAAVITSEDARFVEHEGVDWDAIEKAYQNNKKTGKKIKGGSTITQQLAKNLFLSGERSYLRKGQELVITYMLELWLDKGRILELYLNVVEWGATACLALTPPRSITLQFQQRACRSNSRHGWPPCCPTRATSTAIAIVRTYRNALRTSSTGCPTLICRESCWRTRPGIGVSAMRHVGGRQLRGILQAHRCGRANLSAGP